ncbi:MAG: hypothetical protein KDI21_19525 [Halieaceae bacterium]|nr:hypothetical protein [Halieaceae bacterium]
MAEIITAIYDSRDAVTNAHDDLIGVGIPQDNIRVDADKHQVQVSIGHVVEAEIKEILQRHNPLQLRT